MAPTLLELVEILHRERAALAETTARIRQARVAWEQEHRDDLQRLSDQREAAEEAAEAVRARAVDVYNESGQRDKWPAPGVSIRIEKHLVYDRAVALEWCIRKGVCLRLDQAAFDAMVKNTAIRDQGLSFVTVVDVPVASVAADLARVIPSPRTLGRDTVE